MTANVKHSGETHTGLSVGVGCLAAALAPLLIFLVLQFFGLFAGNNGLGLGLWGFFMTPVARLVLVVGAIVDSRRNQRVRSGEPDS